MYIHTHDGRCSLGSGEYSGMFSSARLSRKKSKKTVLSL